MLRGIANPHLVFSVVLGASGCGGGCPCAAKHPNNQGTMAANVGSATTPATTRATSTNWDHSAAKVPVGKDDPMWGDPDAPVTIVELSDLQCPFCARVEPTLEHIKQKYGPRQVRIVYLHHPLSFHSQAYAAAMAAETVRSIGGSESFFRFVAALYQGQGELSDENYVKWATSSGVDARAFREALASQRAKLKVDADMAVARRIGARGTPAFRINGIELEGAQPFERFREVIDQQLAEAAKLLASGTAKADVYVSLTNRNYVEPAPEREVKAAEPAEQDTTVWKLPVLADDPVLGPTNAPVTIVVFSDFECPYCGRAATTLKQVRDRYKDDVRIVWKDRPLAFHEQALPAAVLARLVLARRGNAAFWTLHDRMFSAQPRLTREALEGLAKEYQVPWRDVESNLAKGRIRERIGVSEDLASDFDVHGTPHFFINGVRLSGAKPYEQFETTINAELTKAKALLQRGVKAGRIYQELTKNGREPDPPERKDAPVPQPSRPSLGPIDAPIVIQQWSDFQCPFCSRVQPTLTALRESFPTQVRIVWRHLPLPFHQQAPLASEAAEEVLAQKGNAAFWAFHDRLFAAQSDPNGLAPESIERTAVELGVDVTEFRAALDTHKHRSKLDADVELARTMGIDGTPAFVINGYFISGAQPISAFRRLIQRALVDKKARR